MKKTAFILLSLGLFLCCLTGFACKDSHHFRFVYMTDIHVQPELDADKGFQTAIHNVNSLKPDFVITGGDLIMDALGQTYERSVQLYDMYARLSQEFNMPVYNTIGNHEVFGLYERSGITPNHPEYGKTMYKKRLGLDNTYYSFDHKGWHFIILDAIGYTPDRRYIGEIDSVQLEWLKQDLQKIDKSTPIAVSTHIPFVSIFEQLRNGGTAALSPGGAVTNSNEVLLALRPYNLKLVLQGHLHIVEEVKIAGIHFITGGAVSGSWWKGPRDVFPEGFMVVEVKGENLNWTYEDYGWEAVRE